MEPKTQHVMLVIDSQGNSFPTVGCWIEEKREEYTLNQFTLHVISPNGLQFQLLHHVAKDAKENTPPIDMSTLRDEITEALIKRDEILDLREGDNIPLSKILNVLQNRKPLYFMQAQTGDYVYISCDATKPLDDSGFRIFIGRKYTLIHRLVLNKVKISGSVDFETDVGSLYLPASTYLNDRDMSPTLNDVPLTKLNITEYAFLETPEDVTFTINA